LDFCELRPGKPEAIGTQQTVSRFKHFSSSLLAPAKTLC
jgi:hypothetical protein